jgi:hypothetical protein
MMPFTALWVNRSETEAPQKAPNPAKLPYAGSLARTRMGGSGNKNVPCVVLHVRGQDCLPPGTLVLLQRASLQATIMGKVAKEEISGFKKSP